MNEISSLAIVEWDGIARDVITGMSILVLFLNVYFITHGWVRWVKTRDPYPFHAAAFIASAILGFFVLFVVTWMLSRAVYSVVLIGLSSATVTMLLSTGAGYLKSIAWSIPAIACGIIGWIALTAKRSVARR